MGVKYVYGGNDIDGFDCSGFVQYIFRAYGYKLPRTAKGQTFFKKRISLKKRLSGDIISFKIKRSWHTGIVINKNYFIHAARTNNCVRIEKLNKYWKNHFYGIIKIID